MNFSSSSSPHAQKQPSSNAAMRIGFGSDNHSGAHPEILAALVAASQGHLPSYGTDAISERVSRIFESHFGPGTETYFVFNGTAANVLSLEACIEPWQSVLCSSQAHLNVDECAAPERYTGAKLIAVPTSDGKFTAEMLKPHLIRKGDQHFAQVGMLSITQPTEVGTLYTLEEIRALARFARENDLLFHMDGTRLVNAAAALNTSLRALTRDSGIDVLSFGGTKNGLVFGEAVVFFRPELARHFKFIRKQAMQLPSKTRFVAAQFEAFLGTDLWLRTARHVNRMAQRLATGLRARPFVEVTQATEANAVFVKIPKAWVSRLKKKYFFYVWDEHTFECRLVCTFDTTEETVDGFLQALDDLAKGEEDQS